MSITLQEEIALALHTLSLSADDLRTLPREEAAQVFQAFKKHFGLAGFRHSHVDDKWETYAIWFRHGGGYAHLLHIVPQESNSVWFITDNWMVRDILVHEGKIEVIQAVIGECFGFEYYVVSKRLEWFLFENFHNYLIGVGKPLVEKMKAFDLL